MARARLASLGRAPERSRVLPLARAMPPSARAIARASARLRRALASATPASAAPDDGILRVAARGRAFPPPALPERPSLARSYAAGIARERTAVTAQLWRARMDAARAAGVFDTDAATKPQDALVPKPPRRHTVRYDFAANEDLREAYRNPWNAVRVGRLLEDLDSLAGNIAFEHCDDADRQTRPQLLVTASVDRVRLVAPLTLDADVVLAGAVAWVGRSSMVIRMEAWPADEYDGAVNTKNADEHSGGSPPEGPERSGSGSGSGSGPSRSLGPSLTADFTFVARDPVTNKGAAVNPLVPDSPAAEALFAATAERVAAKKRRLRTLAAGDAGLSEATREAKRRFAARAMARARALLELPALAPPDVVAVDATRCDNTFVAQPQQRNLSGRIFGGFLLRRAFELAFATTYVFGGARPHFKQVSDMNFLRPVDVGDLLRFRARVLNARNPGEEEPGGGDGSTFTRRIDRPCVDVEVEALVTKPEANFAEVSNTFMFKFWVGAAGEGRTVKTPVPKSPEEAAHVWERCVREDAEDEGGERS